MITVLRWWCIYCSWTYSWTLLMNVQMYTIIKCIMVVMIDCLVASELIWSVQSTAVCLKTPTNHSYSLDFEFCFGCRSRLQNHLFRVGNGLNKSIMFILTYMLIWITSNQSSVASWSTSSLILMTSGLTLVRQRLSSDNLRISLHSTIEFIEFPFVRIETVGYAFSKHACNLKFEILVPLVIPNSL